MVPDVSWNELVQKGDQLVGQGATVWFKWTCIGCGSRQTFEKENTLFTTGRCEECGIVTNLRERGGGMLVLFSAEGKRR